MGIKQDNTKLQFKKVTNYSPNGYYILDLLYNKKWNNDSKRTPLQVQGSVLRPVHELIILNLNPYST